MNPAVLFLLLFVGIPLFELYLMIEIGNEIGAIPTVSLVVFTAILGGMMVRVQGLSTLMRVREAVARDEVPAIEMFEGVVLLAAGLLLLLPGFVTDMVGFLCLIPGVRRALVLGLLKRSNVLRQPPPGPRRASADQPRVIEGEYRRHDN